MVVVSGAVSYEWWKGLVPSYGESIIHIYLCIATPKKMPKSWTPTKKMGKISSTSSNYHPSFTAFWHPKMGVATSMGYGKQQVPQIQQLSPSAGQD